jgi:hypothetical protein
VSPVAKKPANYFSPLADEEKQPGLAAGSVPTPDTGRLRQPRFSPQRGAKRSAEAEGAGSGGTPLTKHPAKDDAKDSNHGTPLEAARPETRFASPERRPKRTAETEGADSGGTPLTKERAVALPPQPPKAEPKLAVRTVASGVQRRPGLKPVQEEGVPRFLVAGLCPKTVSSPAGKQAREVAKEEARKRQEEANERQQEANERQRHRTSTASAAAHRQPTQPAPQAIGLAELRQLLSAEVSGGQLPPPLGSVVKLRVSTLGQRRVVCNVEQYLGDVDAGEERVAAEVTNVGRAEADGMFTVRFEDAETEEEVSVNVDWRPFKLPESLQTAGQALTSAEQMTAETDKLRWPCRMHGPRACVYYKLPAQGGAAATALWGTAQANGLSAGVRRVFDRLCDEATTLAKRLRTEMKSLRRRLASDEESLTAGGPAQSGVSRAQRQRWLQAEALGYRAWLNAQFCSIDEGRVTAHLREGGADEVLARPFGMQCRSRAASCVASTRPA